MTNMPAGRTTSRPLDWKNLRFRNTHVGVGAVVVATRSARLASNCHASIGLSALDRLLARVQHCSADVAAMVSTHSGSYRTTAQRRLPWALSQSP